MIELTFSFVVPFFLGISVAYYGEKWGWSTLKTIVVAAALGCFSGLVGVVTAHADANQAFTRLRQTTVSVDGVACFGSGSLVKSTSGKTYILTNAHVCLCSQYKGRLFTTKDTGELITGEIRKVEWESDLCAARVIPNQEALLLGDPLREGSEVHTRGYPDRRLTESSGVVHGMTEWDYTMPIENIGECPKGSIKERDIMGRVQGCSFHYHSILTDLYSRPGSSGSPVVDNLGRLVGVVSSWHTDTAYDAGLVPYSNVKAFLTGL